jgi:hypothetical protein
MVCCGTCGKRRLPTIVHAAKRNRVARVDPSAIVYVDLDELAAKHPWVVLERGKCAACFEEHANATTAKAKAKLLPCSHPFVQCQTVVVAPFPPPPLTAEEVAHMADVKAKRVEAAPRPCAARACDSRGSEAGRFMAVPLALRPAFPVVQLPGTGAYWQSPWAVVEEGTAPVPGQWWRRAALFVVPLLPSCRSSRQSARRQRRTPALPRPCAPTEPPLRRPCAAAPLRRPSPATLRPCAALA